MASGGTFSLAGHSLGSVICWDLLALKKQQQEQKQTSDGAVTIGGTTVVSSSSSQDHHPMGYEAYAMEEGAATATNGSWGPSLTKPVTQIIPFEPEHTLFLGSPLGIFLTLRGAHPVFDELRNDDGGNSLVSSFTLPTKSLYNIFHPRYGKVKNRKPFKIWARQDYLRLFLTPLFSFTFINLLQRSSCLPHRTFASTA